ncbi:MAG: SpoIIIAH-like family protein [Oscillospiraceae bacterium]|nr:SpoIIIAH-like family protein [Oscillospiraceae bacterium]
MNMIIGKRQIILAALVLGLGIAVYLNWQYSSDNLDLTVTNALDDATTNYGEAQYVDSPNALNANADDINETPDFDEADNDTFFVEAKMSRQKARDEAVETLAVMLADAELDADQKANLALRAADLADSIEAEGKIENLIKAKGFTDVMVYYDAERADIMIRSEGLMSDEVVQIKDIILKETTIPVENISIIEVN